MSYSLQEMHLQCTDIRKKLMLLVQIVQKNQKNKRFNLQKSNLYEAPPKQEFKA